VREIAIATHRALFVRVYGGLRSESGWHVNPGNTPQELIIAFVGEGPLVVDLEGPDPV
jgi:hypothetical protein